MHVVLLLGSDSRRRVMFSDVVRGWALPISLGAQYTYPKAFIELGKCEMGRASFGSARKSTSFMISK